MKYKRIKRKIPLKDKREDQEFIQNLRIDGGVDTCEKRESWVGGASDCNEVLSKPWPRQWELQSRDCPPGSCVEQVWPSTMSGCWQGAAGEMGPQCGCEYCGES